MGVKHKKTATKADSTDDGRVQPSWWNDDHDIGAFLSAMFVLAVTPDTVPYIKTDGSAGAISLSALMRALLPLATAPQVLAALAAAPIDSPNFTGAPSVPTAAPGTTTQQIASTQFVATAVAALVASSPSTLDTLNELATALGDDPNFATTMTNALAARLRFDAPQSLTTPQKAQAISNLALAAVAASGAYADLTGKPTLGTAAALDVGATAGKIVQLDGGGKLPAVNGSALTNVNAASVPGDNILTNGDFRINERAYVSGAALAANIYAHDRWKAGAGGGDYSFTQLKTSTTITIAAGKSLVQVVKDENVVGGSYVLSWTGTAQARIGINGASPSGAYAASPVTVTGQTAATSIAVEFNAGTVGKAKLELGTVATAFIMGARAFELYRCRKYYRKCGGAFAAAYAANTAHVPFDFSADPMQATPAGLYTLNAAGAIIIPGVTTANIVGLTSFTGSGNGGLLVINHSSASTGSGYLNADTVALEAEL